VAELVEMKGKRSDADLAFDLKNRIRFSLEQAAAIMDEARQAGLVLQFQFGIDGFGRNVIASIAVVKPL
jgi:hypothetical protein